MSTEQDTGALPRRSARLAVRRRSVVPPRSKYQQQRLSRRTTPAASSTATAVPVTTGALPACPVQGASEPLSAYLQRVQAFTDVVATAKAQLEAAEAERQRLANEAAAQTQRTAEADAAARDRRNAISTESLIQSENQWTTLLQGMIFVPTDAQADPTPAEAERSNLANLMLSVMRGVMWNNKLLQAHLLTERQHRQKQQQDTAALAAAVRAAAIQQQQQHQLLTSGLARINSIEAQASAAPGCTIDTTKQLNERIDHVVSLIGELGDFTSPATISSTVAAIKTDIAKLQSQPAAAAKVYKMPRFNIGKFEDYNKTDTSTWWQAFLTEASCHKVPAEDMMKALYLQLIGGAQAWMNHLAVNKKTTIAELHKHLTWEDFEQLWFTRFMVRNVVKAAMNEVYTCSQGITSTIGRWMYYIDQFDFDPCHIPGPANRAADALSRRPDFCAIVTTTFDLHDDLQPHFVKGYKSDPTYSTLYAELSSDHPPASHYRISDGFLLLHTRGKDLLVVPQDRILRTRLLGEFHDARLSAHLAVNRRLARLRQRFQWPDVLHDVTRYIESCAVCHHNKGRSRVPFGELKPLPIPRAPRLSIAMDVTGPFPRDRLGHDGILTAVDRLSKYAHFLPCKYHAAAPELARLLHTGWITNKGVPEDIVSDRDTRFMSAFWTSLMAESGTTMKPSSTRHRQTDGQTERAHQTAQMMLRTLIRPDQKDWVDRLPDIEFAYNTSVHPAICITPFELHHGGEKARIFADLLLPQAADIDVPCSPASIRKYRYLLMKARANMQKAQIRMQQQAN
ncbi:hypothetical protein CBR_g19466 [Chara braunii]|uniref:Integrase catalytic domain-containing protein n=1 Tax=Chara braunii TaxID=69332 RepID=A0A388KY43_CHABU|nr:hypothetical protein CBR_g19466 [Chara braunii]|eukprot:GBG74951.1 hypothetical protein CBR_g19466 [Chara braunii]